MADEGAYPYRIQVRLSGAARDSLDNYRRARGGLSISQAVRELCQQAQVRRTVASGTGRLRRAEPVVPHQPRVRLRQGKHKGDGFIKFFMRPSDIGVRLDQGSWDRLSLFAQWRGLTISEAVRELCLRATPRWVGTSSGRDPWGD